MSDESDVDVWSIDPLELGEGVRWTGDRYLLVDIPTGRLFAHGGGGRAAYSLLANTGSTIGAVAPVLDEPATWIAAAGSGVTLLSANDGVSVLATLNPELDGLVRANDAACDPSGRLWVSTMAFDVVSPLGGLYRFDPPESLTPVVSGFAVLNGPAFDASGETMYVSDTMMGTILRLRVEPRTGITSKPRVFAEFDPAEGRPDGLAVDADGNVWTALFGGGAVVRLDNRGRELQRVAVPARYPTSITVRPNLVVLTTATKDDESPAAGHMLAAAVTGVSETLPTRPFRP